MEFPVLDSQIGFIEEEIDASVDVFEEIDRLKRQKNAVLLAHYYQEPGIQDIADYIGDSLGLSRQAAATDADIIVFCRRAFHGRDGQDSQPFQESPAA